MIVLKAAHDKVLSVLQSIAGIVERRHTLPVLANIFVHKSGAIDSLRKSSPVASHLIVCRHPLATVSGHGGLGVIFSSARSNGFFSASKANLRNAP